MNKSQSQQQQQQQLSSQQQLQQQHRQIGGGHPSSGNPLSLSAQQPQSKNVEKFVAFSHARAIIWQLKFSISLVTSKKLMTSTLTEIANLSEIYGKEFDKYVLKELIEQIDLKDPVKSSKDKNEQFKIEMLKQELARISPKHEYLLIFGEIASSLFHDRVGDFLNELTKRLKLGAQMQTLIALSILESSKEDQQSDALKLFKQKLIEYSMSPKSEAMPEYALQRILFLCQTLQELKSDEQIKDIMHTLLTQLNTQLQLRHSANPSPASSISHQINHISFRSLLNPDLMESNTNTSEEPSISMLREGNGLDNLDKTCKMLEPWQILLDLGHFVTYNYNSLLMTFSEFKDINELVMARTLLNLSYHHTGYDDYNSRLIYSQFEAAKKGSYQALQTQPPISDKKNVITWSIDNLSRLFRELYSNLNWSKVFEALGDIDESNCGGDGGTMGGQGIVLDSKGFATFLQVFQKCKPQNIQFPLHLILERHWRNPSLQLNFIENCLSFYIEKKDKSINFLKLARRQETVEELQGVKDKVQQEIIHVWQSVDLVEKLIEISASSGLFQKVRVLLEHPLKVVPEYLLLSLSQGKPKQGNLLLDELLSLLLPQFLGNHINSIPVLQQLWKNNQALMIRGICELCRHDQRIMNLSRVLDITQEVRESLIPIVDCDDYYFAVNLGILAGKRDFLHYDVWLQSRIKEIGTPFIKALLKYIKDHIINPIVEFQNKPQNSIQDLEQFKNAVLDRSHLSKEKLCITVEHLQNPVNKQNPKIKPDTQYKIEEVLLKTNELFPQQLLPLQNSEEIDNAANDYFQRVFSAEISQVDQKIAELIETMQRFKYSEQKKEQEIYACMLHSLFDEYRFLHKYPQQYLEKIAKLFGSIIKNQIIEGTLLDIALKFAFEAFRRDGRRQKFGIITIKQFFDQLPQYPSFFKDIYEIRQNLQNTEPQMLQDLERLYQQTQEEETRQAQQQEEASRAIGGQSQQQQTKKDNKQQQQNQQQQPQEHKNEGYQQQVYQREENISDAAGNKYNKTGASISKLDEGEFLKTFQQKAAIQINRQKNETREDNFKLQGADSQQQPPMFNKAQTGTSQQKQGSQAPSSQQQPQQQQQPTVQTGSNLSLERNTVQAPSFVPSSFYRANETGLNMDSAPFIRPSTTTSTIGKTQPPQQTQPLQQQQPTQQQQQVPQQTSSQIGVLSTNSSAGGSNTTNVPGTAIVGNTNLNLNVNAFRPTTTITPTGTSMLRTPQQTFAASQQILQYQQAIDAKLQKAITDNSKISLENLLEDTTFAGGQGPAQDIQEAIKLICNTIGKQNFNQRLEELKGHIGGNQIFLQWFIHYILTKRLMGQSTNFQNSYIEMIKQMGMRLSVELTVGAAVDCFKKCMAIDEELYIKCAQRGQYQASPLKSYLINLSSFLGGLTVGSNRPILSRELDLKQLLVEGFQNEQKLKYVVVFVCRILKESSKSNIFKVQNPWINALLSILKEIKEHNHVQMNPTYNEIQNEIDSLFKSLSINNPLLEIPNNNFLKALSSSQFASSSQKIELQYIQGKSCLIPQLISPQVQQVQSIQQQQQQQLINNRNRMSPVPPLILSSNSIFGNMSIQPSSIPNRTMTPSNLDLGGGIAGSATSSLMDNQFLSGQSTSNSTGRDSQQQYRLSTQQITERVTISSELFNLINRSVQQTEQQIRKILGEAVDSSIIEILPPVVDRSVTIALITTRELVIKDFAFDGDHQKILKAADLIVKNLAGSLALVTCREPLKMSLTTNLRRALSTITNSNANGQQQQQEVLNDNQINEIAQLASKENLELGCKLIKKAVIDKAQRKVREDPAMLRAIEQRKRYVDLGLPFFRDDQIIRMFSELPPQLQPNQNGLTESQFQVYEDFSRLTTQSNTQRANATTGTTVVSQASLGTRVIGDRNELGSGDDSTPVIITNKMSIKQIDNEVDFSGMKIEDVLEFIETKGITPNIKNAIVNKITQINGEEGKLEEQSKRIWAYIQKWFHTICDKFESDEIINILVEIVSLVANKYKKEDFLKKITHEFLQISEDKIKNVPLNIFLIKNQIISISEWDTQLAIFLNDFAAQNVTDVLQFILEFIVTTIQKQKILTYSQLPNLLAVIEKISSENQIFRDFFQVILDDYLKEGPNNSKIAMLKELFTQWVAMSYGESSASQEQEINKFLNDLTQMEYFKDLDQLSLFCKVMVETSIEKALFTGSGVRRITDRLDYRYIESFIKMIIVLMQTQQQFNKHKFMIKVFESIHEVLDKDHQTNKTQFNQKPYYRMIMNIMTTIDKSNCYNPQTQQLILLSLAELFTKLNPNKYPAFAFSWIELISHKQFMPHFLKYNNHLQFLQNQNVAVGSNVSSSGVASGNAPNSGKKIAGQSNTGSASNATNLDQASADNIFYNKYFRFKELIVQLYTFLKQNMPPQQSAQQPLPPCLEYFYFATLRVTLVILHDFPEFLSDFHFNFVNSLPDQCIQLKNLILSAYPKNIQPPNPFQKSLKVDLLNEVKSLPRISSNYENYLSLMNLREDLEQYCRNKNPVLIETICTKMMASEEIINGKRRINAAVINAVVLFIAHQTNTKNVTFEVNHKESMELFKSIALRLNGETRWCLLNSIINELRYPNSLTYYFSCILLFLFVEAASSKEQIQEQIAKILFERVSANKPNPWGLMISFRELIQNPKYGFMQKSFIVQNQALIDDLFQNQLEAFQKFLPKQANSQQQQQQQQQQPPQQSKNQQQTIGQQQQQ